MIAHDVDGEDESHHISWFPEIGPTDSNKTYPIFLSNEAGPAEMIKIFRSFEEGGCTVSVRSTKDRIGESVEFEVPGRPVKTKRINANNGRGSVDFFLPHPGNGMWPKMTLSLKDAVPVLYDALPSVKAIRKAYINAIGGQDVFSTLQSRTAAGRYLLDVREDGAFLVSIPFESVSVSPNRWKISLLSNGTSEVNAFDGETGWKLNRDRLLKEDGLGYSILGWWCLPQGPVSLDRYFPKMTLKGRRMDGKRILLDVESVLPDGSLHILSFDGKTGLLFSIDSVWRLEDYRLKDGALFPHRLIRENGDRINMFQWDKMEHNRPVDTAAFDLPAVENVFSEVFEGLEPSPVLPMLQLKDLTYPHSDMNIPCRDGRFLYDMVIKNGYKRGLEIGTFTGYSTLWLGLAFQRNGGRVTTLEIDPECAQEAQENFLKAGLDDVIHSRVGDALLKSPCSKGHLILFLSMPTNRIT